MRLAPRASGLRFSVSRIVAVLAFITAFGLALPAYADSPSATLVSAPDVVDGTPADIYYVLTVQYQDDVAVKLSSLGDGDISVSGPHGPYLPSLVSVDPNTDGSPRTATYRFIPDGPYGFGHDDNGVYTISIVANEVTDTDDTPNSVPAGSIGTFTVNLTEPVFTLSGGGTICAGASTTVTVDIVGGVPPWHATFAPQNTLDALNTSIRHNVISVSPPSTITYTIISVQGGNYDSGGGRGEATVNVNPSPTVFDVTGGGGPSCIGASVGLSGSEVGVAYTLSRDGTPAEVKTTSGGPIDFGPQAVSGTYTVRATTAAQCSKDMNGSAIVIVTPPELSIQCPPNIQIECNASSDPSNTGEPTVTAVCVGEYRVGKIDETFSSDVGFGFIKRTWFASTNERSSSCEQLITFNDTQPPVISGLTVVGSPVLWPPNHTMHDVTVTYGAADNCGRAVTTQLSVTSNEAPDGLGDGDTAPDWEIVNNTHVRLRAERSGKGTGRIYTITVTATDASGNSSTATTTVVVAHNITGPANGAAYKVNTAVGFSGTFWDAPGMKHTAQWTFDNLAAPGTVAESVGLKAGSVTGKYTFTAAGVYKVTLNLADQNGAKTWVNTAGDVDAVVVVYDASAGYTIGSGWFASPAGAYRAKPTATGKVSFGFTSKYFKSATYPKGEALFEFKLAGLEFEALNYDYLVVAGVKAQFRGMGKLNGEGGYKFTLTVIDGQLSGGGGTDKVRLKLFNKSGTVVYDTQYGASDAANPTLAVGSGSNILIKTTGVSAGPAVAGGAIADGESQPIEASRPAAFALSPGRPNPFTTATELHYALPEQAHVELSLYNALGERVEVLANGIQEPGYKSIELDGRRLTPGMYFLRFRATVGGAQPFVQTRKLLVIR